MVTSTHVWRDLKKKNFSLGYFRPRVYKFFNWIFECGFLVCPWTGYGTIWCFPGTTHEFLPVVRHVTIYTPSDKLEARRHTIDAIQLTPVNLQNLLLNSEDFLWAPWNVTTVLFTYSRCSSNPKYSVNRHLTSPTKYFPISRIATLEFTIIFTHIRRFIGCRRPKCCYPGSHDP